MSTDKASNLVSVDWLKSRRGDTNLVVLDASVPPVVPGFVSVNADAPLKVIPGARRFDYDQQICKPNSSLPHMMPDAELFQSEVRKLGANKDSLVVVYDDVGIYASPRAWWMLKAMGHDQVKVLDGGLPAWIDAGLEVDSDYAADVPVGDFVANERPDYFCDFEVVLAALEDADTDILDARSEGRFYGRDPEPRPGIRGGHMPGAKNLPCVQVLDGQFLKNAAELRQLLGQQLDPEKTLITSCGSGVTACILTLAAAEAGYPKLAVYDGSWVEWGQPSKLPVVTEG